MSLSSPVFLYQNPHLVHAVFAESVRARFVSYRESVLRLLCLVRSALAVARADVDMWDTDSDRRLELLGEMRALSETFTRERSVAAFRVAFGGLLEESRWRLSVPSAV
jgi:hypothetical protein